MYATAVREAGGTPVEVSLQLTAREMATLAQGCDGVLLPGSPADVEPELYGRKREAACAPGDPDRDRVDRLLLEEAYASGKPVLGVCYGMQSLNVWRGGTLLQHAAAVPVNHEAGSSVAVAHTVAVTSGSRLAEYVADEETVRTGEELRLPVNSSHHQAVEQVGDGLRAVAVSSQDGVIEAVEGSAGAGGPSFLLGVQWHPERSTGLSATSRRIFAAFVETAGAHARGREPAGVQRV